MRKRKWDRLLYKRSLLILAFLIALSIVSLAQNLPEIVPDIDMFFGHWKESMPCHSHGSLVERNVLTKCEDDPAKPTIKSAVLTRINSFSYVTLAANNSTQPITMEGAQEIFYFISGEGTMTAGGKTADLYGGIAVLMPAGLEFTMTNTCDEPLVMYLTNEPIPKGFRPNADMFVRDVNTLPISGSTALWSNITKSIFRTQDGLGTLEMVITVTLDPMTLTQSHPARKGAEMIWTAIKGTGLTCLWKELRKQPPGMAYMCPPDGQTAHSIINGTDEQITFLYIA